MHTAITWPNTGGFQEGREKHFVHGQHSANFLSAPERDDKSRANGSERFFLFQEIVIVFCEMSIVGSRSKTSVRKTSNPHNSKPLGEKQHETSSRTR